MFRCIEEATSVSLRVRSAVQDDYEKVPNAYESLRRETAEHMQHAARHIPRGSCDTMKH